MSVGYFDRPMPRWLRRLGCFDLDRQSARFRWGLEVSRGWGLGFELCLFDDALHYSLHVRPVYGDVFLRLPFRARREPAEMMESWGLSWTWSRYGGPIHLHWGARTKILEMPLRPKHHSAEILCADGSWRPRKDIAFVGGKLTSEYDSARDPLPDVHVERHPYHYMLDSGEVQHVEATVIVERRTWRRIKRLPWPRKVSRSIDISFSDEVGAARGSWKGGCIGCGYEMRPGEAPRDTLRRMQRERRFR